MMRLFTLLAVALFEDVLEARPQDFIGPSSRSFDDGVGSSTLPFSDQPLTFETNPSAHDSSGITAQSLSLNPTDLDLSSDIAYLASPFADTGDFDMNDDDSLFPPSLFDWTAPSLTEPNVEIGYADNALYDDDLTISYNKFPLYPWPSDRTRILFPFNCWRENKDGYLCTDNRCKMAFAYAPGENGARFCCEKWDDLVEPKCVPAPAEDQLTA